jgi:asparagine synthase (glutamine-hydrolysing)
MKAEAARIGGNRYYLSGGLASRVGPDTQFLADKIGFRPCDIARGFSAEKSIRFLLDADFRRELESPSLLLADELSRIMPETNGYPHAMLLQYVQLNSSVPEYINLIADRSENAGSMEARMPLFDHKVVELAMGLPIESKLNGDQEKWILREAFKEVLPQTVTERRKQAFLAPPAPFSSPEGRMLVETYLSPSAIKEAGVWSPTRIAALRAARRFLPNNRIVNLLITIVLTTQILLDQFVVHRPSWR